MSGDKEQKFAGPTARGVLDLVSDPVFAHYCTIFFDNMAPPWGVCWRKCDSRGSVADPPRLTRSSADVSRGIRKTIKTNITFWMPFCLEFGSTWHPNWLNFGISFPYSFWAYSRCVFFGPCSIFDPANPQIWCSRLGAVRFFEFSSNRTQIQNERKISPKWLPESTEKPLKIKTQIN